MEAHLEKNLSVWLKFTMGVRAQSAPIAIAYPSLLLNGFQCLLVCIFDSDLPPPKYFPKFLHRNYEECVDEKLPKKVPKIFYTVNMRGVSTFVDAVDVWNARRIYAGMWL